jgi:hypothetical protein
VREIDFNGSFGSFLEGSSIFDIVLISRNMDENI